ncbi:uncharacterized protein BX663DRAFT_502321 [Cokeromyces recurvatus]|uniref:uncharacterized protein n=1 Tax=Cokeromyces recurvatus TaxID=90255 RepID=UPI00221E83FC|nr:uncharacterized protein BX663DRAFT_502321 [Cokeromyces recurvatus]KAI7905276.1 hypothetical protein BX663DRAFT_502321 [Cokeromyces recurvatus]
MSIEHVDKLEKIQHEITCTICQGIFEDPHSLNCGHCYCGQCIFEWLKNNKSCPICRVPAIRQPIHIITLQQLSNFFRPANAIPSTRLTRADWIQLYPIDNQANCIRDEDEDGVIYRCSQCGWELDEENFCSNCMITFTVDRPNNDNFEVSDTESHHEDERDLSDFVVDDDESIIYSDDSHTFPNEQEPVEISDDDEERVLYNNRKRRIELISEDDETDDDTDSKSVISISEEEDEDEEDEEEDEDLHRRSAVSRFIDDYAEDEDEIEETRKKSPEIDKITENIIRAKNRMISNSSSNSTQMINDSDSNESSSDESDVPDYENLLSHLSDNNEAENSSSNKLEKKDKDETSNPKAGKKKDKKKKKKSKKSSKKAKLKK